MATAGYMTLVAAICVTWKPAPTIHALLEAIAHLMPTFAPAHGGTGTLTPTFHEPHPTSQHIHVMLVEAMTVGRLLRRQHSHLQPIELRQRLTRGRTDGRRPRNRPKTCFTITLLRVI